jgi:hypothetical protein
MLLEGEKEMNTTSTWEATRSEKPHLASQSVSLDYQGALLSQEPNCVAVLAFEIDRQASWNWLLHVHTLVERPATNSKGQANSKPIHTIQQ